MEAVKQRFEPGEPEPHNPEQKHNLDGPLEPGERAYTSHSGGHDDDEARTWQDRNYEGSSSSNNVEPEEEPNPWNTPQKGRT